MNSALKLGLLFLSFGLAACSTSPTVRPQAWFAPEAVVAPSSFHGVHGLAIDTGGRLLAGSVLGNSIWEVDRQTGSAKILIGGPEGQADDIAIGPKGEMAWTSFLQGVIRYRQNDGAAIRVLAKDLPGINSLAFDQRNGKLYASQVFLGDAMWEIDVAGNQPPRQIAKGMGGFNGFEVGPDGMIYGPLWFKGQVVKMNPADGTMSVIASGFKVPAAANLDGKGNLWVVDTRAGELSKVNLASGQKTVVSQLSSAIDNLAIAPEGTIYVSNMADNGVQAFDPATGSLRQLTSGKLAVPGGIKLDGKQLFIADVFGFRQLDLKSGAVRDIFRMQASELEYPFSVGLSATRYALTSWFTGSVQIVDRATQKTVKILHGLKAPMDAQFLADGSIVYAEIASGTITRASGADFSERKVIASNLAGPVQILVGPHDDIYVTEAAGNLARIRLADGSKTIIADKLALPEGLAFTPWGTIVVAEAAAQRLTEVDLATGARRTVADNLPIGLEAGPGLPPPYVATGVAVDTDGTVYVSADRNNAVYKIRPQ